MPITEESRYGISVAIVTRLLRFSHIDKNKTELSTYDSIYYYLYHEGGVGYGIYTMRQTHIGRGGYEFVSLYICHIVCRDGVRGMGFFDLHLVIMASDSLRMCVMG